MVYIDWNTIWIFWNGKVFVTPIKTKNTVKVVNTTHIMRHQQYSKIWTRVDTTSVNEKPWHEHILLLFIHCIDLRRYSIYFNCKHDLKFRLEWAFSVINNKQKCLIYSNIIESISECASFCSSSTSFTGATWFLSPRQMTHPKHTLSHQKNANTYFCVF